MWRSGRLYEVMNELIEPALRGDQGSVEQLLEGIWPTCYRLAVAVVGDRSLAQDAAQEACAIVYAKIHTLRNAAAFDSWLYRIVMREAGRVRRRLSSDAEPYEGASFVPDQTIGIDVWRAMAALRPELRDVVVLFYFYELRSEEIASILRTPHSTVRTRLARARERLRALLGDYADDARFNGGEMKHYAV